MKLQILGCNSALPSAHRFTSSQILNIDEQYILIDCGEATQIRLLQLGLSHFRIQTILISHLHGDHYYGLIGLLSSMALAGRQKKLELIGPHQLLQVLEPQMGKGIEQLPFELDFIPIPEGEVFVAKHTPKLKITAVPTRHSIPCHGFRIEQIKPKYRLLPDKCRERNIPISAYKFIKEGQDYLLASGELVSYTEFTEPISFTNYSYAYSADTAYLPSLAEHFRGVHTLYHESTYLEDRRDRAEEYMHSTAREAARVAEAAEAARLILGHYSSAYPQLGPFLRQAKEIFPATELAEDGYIFHWPKPARKH